MKTCRHCHGTGKQDASNREYIKAAKRLYEGNYEGEIEIDLPYVASAGGKTVEQKEEEMVSATEDGGVWVQAWVWVSDEEVE